MEKKEIHELWDGTKVYLVHGNDIRDNYDTKFIGGGHGYVYDYVPKDEIWIEIQEEREDIKEILTHEIIEYIFMKYNDLSYDDAHDIANIVEDTIRAIPDEKNKPLPSEPPQENGKEDPKAIKESNIKFGYIVHMPGHKNSKGESSPYVIKSHDNNKILSSHKTKAEAEKHLKQMKYYKNKKGDRYMDFRKFSSIEDLIKMADIREEVVEMTGNFTSSERIIDRAVEIMSRKFRELLELPLEEDDIKKLISKLKDSLDSIEKR